MSQAASAAWFARHEARLVWRDWLGMLQAGRRSHRRTLAIGIIVFVAFLHAIGYLALAPYAAAWRGDKAALFALTGSGFLVWTLMLSQAMESATRAFYARADLDLILSSPASARPIFAIRIAAIALAMTGMALLLFGPFINILVVVGGPRFLGAYGVLAVMGLTSAAGATAATLLLFQIAGPARTRLIAQIVAAVVGAGFVIGVQAAAIISYGSLSRTAIFQSAEWIAAAPGLDSVFWWPARAATGDWRILLLLLLGAALVLAGTIAVSAGRFVRYAQSVAGVARGTVGAADRKRGFRTASNLQSLRRKDWLLLARDPWLVSQSLMQLLYLLPPALLLWRNFGAETGSLIVLIPVLVMAAGQLAGGLAWLAISGEDAPDLIATAPITPRAILFAKVQAVMAMVAVPILPFALAIAFASPWNALVMLFCATLAAAAAIAIQIAFKAQAKRSHFRRRQTSSRLATFAEAFASISVAAAAGLAAAGSWLTLGPLVFALLVVAFSTGIAPRQEG